MAAVIHSSDDGLLHKTMVAEADVFTISKLLNSAVPFVWLAGYVPRSDMAWWKVTLPFSEASEIREAEVRELQFDAMLSTTQFLSVVNESENALCDGRIDIIQLAHKVPSTLRFNIENPQMDRILVNNGMFLRIRLPHAGASAQLVCTDLSYLESLIDRDGFTGRMYW